MAFPVLKAKLLCLTKSKFARNVAVVTAGTAGAQAITMIFAPLITRVYGPEAFGLLGVFMALIAIFTPVAALTYPTAIVLPKEDADAKGVAKLAFWLALIISIITAIILFFVGDELLKLIGSDAISSFVMLIPVAMFFAAMLQITQQWLIRKKQFRTTAKIAVAQSLIINSAKTGFGWLNPVAAVLIIIATLGTALHALMMWLGIKRNLTAQAKMNPEYQAKTTQKLAAAHKDFPIYRAPQVFINAVSQSLPVLILASFFGPASAGFYAIGKMVLGVPSSLIGKSVGNVFYPRITEAAHNKENLTRLIINATVALAAVGFLPFALVIAFGPWLFGLVFGSEWVTAGEYARWLALWFLFLFMNGAAVTAIPVLNLQSFFLWFEIVTVLSRLIGLYIGFAIFQSDQIAVAIFGVLGAVLNISLIFLVIGKATKFDKCER